MTEAALSSTSTSETIDTNKFLSIVMAIMFLARFTRPDISFPVTYLATKSSAPTQQHLNQCQRILDYIKGTQSAKITYRSDANMIPVAYSDASHAIHPDGKGHGGILICMGSGPIMHRSFKLKMISRSSTESELIALEETSTYVIWIHELLRNMKITVHLPITIYQDNLSAIFIAHNGGSFKRTKHLIIKENFIREQITTNRIKIVHMSTVDIPADFLTKPLAANQLQHLLSKISFN